MDCSVTLKSKLPQVKTTIFTRMSALAAQENALNLSQGFPDFDCPPALSKAVQKAMAEGKNQYAPMAGLMSLREKIARKTQELYGAEYHPETEITITAGATQALFTAITAVIRYGDEALIFEPAYDCYAPAVELAGGVCKFVKLKPSDSYKIDWEAVKKLCSKNTRLIIINSPHNPSGSVLGEEDMKKLEKLVEGTDIVILSDEVYEHIVFDGIRHESICRYPNLARRSFVVSSFGKTYHVTGWKTGYVVAPAELMAEFRKVHQYNVFCVNHPMQAAICDFMDNTAHHLELAAFYQTKRDLFVNLLNGSRFEITPSAGTYFQNLNYTAITEEGDVDFAVRLTREHKIASIPLSVFYRDNADYNRLRFCFAKGDETLKKAAEILCRI
ncbi:MAG: pyridoxal phosphate-dependent aminotransferase [Flavobacteriales bacterium]|nr:pyridoxal phosphate-dependent aminotransferase [Flavobacteriales bacterium]